MSTQNIVIRIREVSTGKEIESIQEVDEEYLDNQRFYYEEGNGCCDCNRKLLFGQVQDIEFSDEETPCGYEKFKIQVLVADKIILNEWE